MCTATLVFFMWITAKVLVLVWQTFCLLNCLSVTIFHTHPFFHILIFISFKFKYFILGSSLTPKVTFQYFHNKLCRYNNINKYNNIYQLKMCATRVYACLNLLLFFFPFIENFFSHNIFQLWFSSPSTPSTPPPLPSGSTSFLSFIRKQTCF